MKATDGAANATETTRTFAIDATAPATQITDGPADGSSSTVTSATFTFSADENGSTFQCRVYPAALTPGAFGPFTGSGAHSASGFSPGTYASEIRATDPHGNADSSPAKRTLPSRRRPTPAAPAAPEGPGEHRRDRREHRRHRRRQDPRQGQHVLEALRQEDPGRDAHVSNAPVGSTVKVTCKGTGCKFKTLVLKLNGSKLALAKKFKKKRLAAGSVITITVSREGWIAKTFRYTTRAGKFPKLTLS